MDATTIGLIISNAGAVIIAVATAVTSSRKKTVTDLQALVGNLQKTVDTLTTENVRLVNENKALNDRLNVLECKDQETYKTILKLQNDNLQLSVSLDIVKGEKQKLLNQIAELQTEQLRLEKENKILQARIDILESKKE